tara:strand:- start:1120 stop:1467 length:348 start_codon:yes stop_codon:yes gene_type:complete
MNIYNKLPIELQEKVDKYCLEYANKNYNNIINEYKYSRRIYSWSIDHIYNKIHINMFLQFDTENSIIFASRPKPKIDIIEYYANDKDLEEINTLRMYEYYNYNKGILDNYIYFFL